MKRKEKGQGASKRIDPNPDCTCDPSQSLAITRNQLCTDGRDIKRMIYDWMKASSVLVSRVGLTPEMKNEWNLLPLRIVLHVDCPKSDSPKFVIALWRFRRSKSCRDALRPPPGHGKERGHYQAVRLVS